MIRKQIPLTIDGINESIYAGFGVRLGALLLDFLIMLPIYYLILFLNGLSKEASYFTILPGLFLQFWYYIYLVKKYGGTPGKLITGIRIIKMDGTDVEWREAILREIIAVFLSILFAVITLVALSRADIHHYESLNWREKHKYLITLTPVLYIFYKWVSNIWMYSELVVLLFNRRRRALHDFIAGTVIVKLKYLSRIRETGNDLKVTVV
jgi:uncharacterized RDD family membrane protein YckC